MQHANVEAELLFRSTASGGREGPAFSGYRSQIYYDDRAWDVVHYFPDVVRVEPGDRVRAFLAFLSPHLQRGRLQQGMSFQVREGHRVVATGRIARILSL